MFIYMYIYIYTKYRLYIYIRVNHHLDILKSVRTHTAHPFGACGCIFCSTRVCASPCWIDATTFWSLWIMTNIVNWLNWNITILNGQIHCKCWFSISADPA